MATHQGCGFVFQCKGQCFSQSGSLNQKIGAFLHVADLEIGQAVADKGRHVEQGAHRHAGDAERDHRRRVVVHYRHDVGPGLVDFAVDIALAHRLAAGVVQRPAVEVVFEDVLGLHPLRRDGVRQVIAVRILRRAQADVAIGVDHAVLGEDAVRGDQVVEIFHQSAFIPAYTARRGAPGARENPGPLQLRSTGAGKQWQAACRYYGRIDTEVIIVGAGAAAHLAGVVAAHTTLPVIGVPIDSSGLKGLDALLSTVQMPAGVPVATMAIGKAGAANAGIFAAAILARGNAKYSAKLSRLKKEMASGVEKKDRKLRGGRHQR